MSGHRCCWSSSTIVLFALSPPLLRLTGWGLPHYGSVVLWQRGSPRVAVGGAEQGQDLRRSIKHTTACSRINITDCTRTHTLNPRRHRYLQLSSIRQIAVSSKTSMVHSSNTLIPHIALILENLVHPFIAMVFDRNTWSRAIYAISCITNAA